jgi:hypothetical protein
MNIDIDYQGLTLKVQEEASLPISPKGPQFLHIIAAGLLLSFIVPIGIVFGLTFIDQKIRSNLIIREFSQLPIWASVHDISAPKERKGNFLKVTAMVLTVIAVWSIYAYAIYIKKQSYGL